MIKKVILSDKEKHHLFELVKGINCVDEDIKCDECPFNCPELENNYNGCLVDKLKEIYNNN